MSTPPAGGEKTRNWNLGKPTAKAPAAPPPPAPSEASTPEAARPGRLAPPAPRPVAAPAPPDAATDNFVSARERAAAERPPLGRAVMPDDEGGKKGSLLTHPVTMAIVAVGFTASLLYLFFSGALFGPNVKTMPPPKPEERVAAFLGTMTTQQLATAAPSGSVSPVGQGWVLMSTGQILNEVAAFLEQDGNPAPVAYQSIPGILRLVRLPPGDTPEFYRGRMDWDERALGSIQIGQDTVTRARNGAARAADVRRVAQLLVQAGMAKLDGALKGTDRADFPGIDGAADRWKAARPTGALEAADAELLRTVLPADTHRLVNDALSAS